METRAYWVGEIQKLSGAFSDDAQRLAAELAREVLDNGAECLLAHLRTCGDIPEEYRHDSSEEKLYAKYTDLVIAEAFRFIGLPSLVLTERADVADVEVAADRFGFVADAKAFRLSRTAKNAKDFKVSSMHTWKRGKAHAVLVCPVHQLPASASQIYLQATSLDVLILSYSHLALLVGLKSVVGEGSAQHCLTQALKAPLMANPSKDAVAYWTAINRAMLGSDSAAPSLWRLEKAAAVASLAAEKERVMAILGAERDRIMRLSHEEAIHELIGLKRIDARSQAIRDVRSGRLLELA